MASGRHGQNQSRERVSVAAQRAMAQSTGIGGCSDTNRVRSGCVSGFRRETRLLCTKSEQATMGGCADAGRDPDHAPPSPGMPGSSPWTDLPYAACHSLVLRMHPVYYGTAFAKMYQA